MPGVENISEDGQAGKATESPAFTDLSCTEAGTTGRPTRPTGRPDLAPGKPDTTRNANDGADTEAEKSEKAGTSEDAPNARADTHGGGTADRGKSGEHRQEG